MNNFFPCLFSLKIQLSYYSANNYARKLELSWQMIKGKSFFFRGVEKLVEKMSFTWDTEISISVQLNSHSHTYIVWTKVKSIEVPRV